MTKAEKKCKRSCVEAMRALLRLDEKTQQLIIGPDYRKRVEKMRQLVDRYEKDCIDDWLKRNNWPFF